MLDEKVKEAQTNTLRVAQNLQVLLNDSSILAPTKYAQAILESQQLISSLVADLKKSLEDNKLAPAVEAEVVTNGK